MKMTVGIGTATRRGGAVFFEARQRFVKNTDDGKASIEDAISFAKEKAVDVMIFSEEEIVAFWNSAACLWIKPNGLIEQVPAEAVKRGTPPKRSTRRERRVVAPDAPKSVRCGHTDWVFDSDKEKNVAVRCEFVKTGTLEEISGWRLCDEHSS